MKNIYLLSLTFLLIACSKSKENSASTELINNSKDSTSIIKETTIQKTELAKPKLSEHLDTNNIEALTGLWVSKEYSDILTKQNSITKTNQIFEFYTSIILDDNKYLRSYKPDLMEEDYLKLNNDFSASGYNNELIYKITAINDSLLTIEDTNGFHYNYYLDNKNIKDSRLSQSLFDGTKSIHLNWLAGTYNLKCDTLNTTIKIDSFGNMTPNIFESVVPFSYKEKDLIEFNYSKDSSTLVLIESIENTYWSLIEVEDIMDEGDPIIKKTNKVLLTKL